jgi:microcin C transport system substrate-binding protein
MTATADDPYGFYCYMCTTLEYPESMVGSSSICTFANGT